MSKEKKLSFFCLTILLLIISTQCTMETSVKEFSKAILDKFKPENFELSNYVRNSQTFTFSNSLEVSVSSVKMHADKFLQYSLDDGQLVVEKDPKLTLDKKPKLTTVTGRRLKRFQRHNRVPRSFDAVKMMRKEAKKRRVRRRNRRNQRSDKNSTVDGEDKGKINNGKSKNGNKKNQDQNKDSKPREEKKKKSSEKNDLGEHQNKQVSRENEQSNIRGRKLKARRYKVGRIWYSDNFSSKKREQELKKLKKIYNKPSTMTEEQKIQTKTVEKKSSKIFESKKTNGSRLKKNSIKSNKSEFKKVEPHETQFSISSRLSPNQTSSKNTDPTNNQAQSPPIIKPKSKAIDSNITLDNPFINKTFKFSLNKNLERLKYGTRLIYISQDKLMKFPGMCYFIGTASILEKKGIRITMKSAYGWTRATGLKFEPGLPLKSEIDQISKEMGSQTMSLIAKQLLESTVTSNDLTTTQNPLEKDLQEFKESTKSLKILEGVKKKNTLKAIVSILGNRTQLDAKKAGEYQINPKCKLKLRSLNDTAHYIKIEPMKEDSNIVRILVWTIIERRVERR